MEKPNKATKNEVQTKQQVASELTQLGITLLDSAVTHTSAWKRSNFEIPQDQTQNFFEQIIHCSMGEMLVGLKGYKEREGSDKPYDFETIQLNPANPVGAVLSVEQFGPYGDVDKYHSTEFSITFLYGKNGQDYYLRAKLTNNIQEGFAYENTVIEPYNYWTLSSSSYQPEMFETGYEGSDGRQTRDVTKEHLQLFLSVFNENTKDTQIKEPTLAEQMSQMKMVDLDTNQAFYFDPQRQEFFSTEGVPMKEHRSPIADLPSDGKVLRVVGQYDILPLDEGEANPFVK